MKCLRLIDFFGPQISIHVEGYDRYKTLTGGLLTLAYLILIGLAFFAFGRDLFEKKLPNVTFNRIVTDTVNFNLTATNFKFAIFNQADNSEVENFERKFVFYLDVFYNAGQDYTQATYHFQKCGDTLPADDKFVVNKNLYYCLPPGTSIAIDGVFSNPVNTAARLNVDLCINGVNNRTDCLPQQQILAETKNLNLHHTLNDYYAMTLNYTDPITPNQFSAEIVGTPGVFTRQFVYFKQMEVKTDQGWILDDINTKAVTAIDSTSLVSNPSQNSNTIFSNMYMHSSFKDTYSRNYIKVQGVVAYIGGFLSFSSTVLRFVCLYVIYPDILFLFYTNYKEKKEQTAKVNVQDRSQFVPLNNIGINPVPNERNSIRSFTRLNEIGNITFTKKRVKVEYSKLSFTYKLLRHCCIKSKRLKEETGKLEEVDSLFRKKLSLSHLTNVSRKVKLFESVLFEEYQRRILKYVGIPQHEKTSINYSDLCFKIKRNMIDKHENSVNSKILFYLKED